MQAKAGQVHTADFGSYIKAREYASNLVRMVRLQLPPILLLEQKLQTLVAEAAYHNVKCNRSPIIWREWRFRGNGAGQRQTDSEQVPLAAYNRRHGVTVDAETARCGWRGERMDYGLAMERLCWDSGMGP